VSPELDSRLAKLKAELDDHARIAHYLGMDFERPIRYIGDGYPQNAISWVGKYTERLLKRLWRHHKVPGSPGGKMLKDLINGCKPFIRSHRVVEALHDIQRIRNRSAHDGYQVADEDGLLAVRRLIDVLDWYASTGSGALSDSAPRLVPAVAAKAEFLAGLYVTLDFKLAQRFELSQHTVYQLFVRERGLRSEYVELLLSRDVEDVAKVLEVTGGDLLQTALPKLTRFLILEENGVADLPDPLRADYRVVSYDRFMDAFVDLDAHLADVANLYPRLDAATTPVAGDLLRVDERSGQMLVSSAGEAAGLLRQVAAGGGNLLIVGRPGSGKTTLLKLLVAGSGEAGERRYRFFFDLSLKGREEPFADFVTRVLAPYMRIEAAYVFAAFCYFARAGSVLCALDGFDEAVPEMTLAGFLTLFTEIAEVLSAESAVVMTSRVSFLEDSPQVRRLLDGTRLVSEKLVQQLHAHGVDPLRVPRFSVLRLRDDQAGRSLLGTQLARGLRGGGGTTGSAAGELAELLWRHMAEVVEPGPLPQVVEFFGLAFLRGVTVFTLIEIVNELGFAVFDGTRVDFGAFRLRELFRTADAGGSTVAFRHMAYQELLAAEFLRTAEGREAAFAATKQPRVTEQVREFLHQRSTRADQVPTAGLGGDLAEGEPAAVGPGDGGTCVVPAGVYVVGPSHHLMLRRLERPFRIDRFPVTVARYKRFLAAVAEHGSGEWDHPDMPGGYTHQPWRDRLRVPSYYDDPVYENHPAIAVNWWSAYAFARFEGKRLPTSLEWEAGARGTDGRLFPWGDNVDLAAANCADSWSDRPLITYEAWKEKLDRGGLRDALPGRVDAHPGNVSPFGVREMAGNVWEWTATVLGDLNEAVICGGSFDNPYRAIQASSKGTYRRRGASNAVGFRCAQDI
jgi:hypothetical protein